VYVLQGNVLTAEKAFFTIAISSTVVRAVDYFSNAVSGLGECLVSSQRIKDFLLLPEQPPRPENNKPSKEAFISLKNVTAFWDKKAVLKNMNLQLDGDKLVIIFGAVGSGKSSLLSLLMSEISDSEGVVDVRGVISYSSQEAWVFPGSLRQNILFGEEYNAHKYNQVVACCALLDDCAQLLNGDMTIIGERGVTLSGGQKVVLFTIGFKIPSLNIIYI
jgi:ABC-type multidrug transport system fused ATPase/permease subunit